MLSVDDSQQLYWDIVFCANNINQDGSLTQFLTVAELERVYNSAVANSRSLDLYIEDKVKFGSNWGKLQGLYAIYAASTIS